MTSLAGESFRIRVAPYSFTFVSTHSLVINAMDVTRRTTQPGGTVYIALFLPRRQGLLTNFPCRVTVVAPRRRRIAHDVEKHAVVAVELGLVVLDLRQRQVAPVRRPGRGRVVIVRYAAGLAADRRQTQRRSRRPAEVLQHNLARELGRVVRHVGGVADHAVDFEIAGDLPALGFVGGQSPRAGL